MGTNAASVYFALLGKRVRGPGVNLWWKGTMKWYSVLFCLYFGVFIVKKVKQDGYFLILKHFKITLMINNLIDYSEYR